MAEVILFRPKERCSRSLAYCRPPLGLLYLGAALKKEGISVSVIDTGTTSDWRSELRNAIADDTLLAGVGVMTGYQIKGAIDFFNAVKSIKSIPVIWGGLHASILPEQTIQNVHVDIVAVGEGEETIVSIVKKLRNNESLESVPSISFKKNGEIIRTSVNNKFMDMNELPLPEYSLVDVEHYATIRNTIDGASKRVLDINSNRGCPHRCGFCYNLNFNRKQWRNVSADNLVRAVETLVDKYNLDGINFVADEFFINKKNIKRFCEGLLERNIKIKWHSDMRIDTFLRYDDALLDLMKQSGCNQFDLWS
ncbi:MAG: B12-binding domain-containing radical SAM protein [Candidatus Anammoxibacter sp.]